MMLYFVSVPVPGSARRLNQGSNGVHERKLFSDFCVHGRFLGCMDLKTNHPPNRPPSLPPAAILLHIFLNFGGQLKVQSCYPSFR